MHALSRILHSEIEHTEQFVGDQLSMHASTI